VASHDSALKAHRQNIERRERNRQMRTRLRRALRDIRSAIDTGDAASVKDALRTTTRISKKSAAA
jgi:small subunit ribosomal protein S20